MQYFLDMFNIPPNGINKFINYKIEGFKILGHKNLRPPNKLEHNLTRHCHLRNLLQHNNRFLLSRQLMIKLAKFLGKYHGQNQKYLIVFKLMKVNQDYMTE